MHYNSEINNRWNQRRAYTYLFQVFTLLDLSFRVSGTWGQAQYSIDRIRLGVKFSMAKNCKWRHFCLWICLSHFILGLRNHINLQTLILPWFIFFIWTNIWVSAMLQVLSKAPETYSSPIRLKLIPEGRHNTCLQWHVWVLHKMCSQGCKWPNEW